MAHGDAREGKWSGNWRLKWVASTLTLPRNVVYPALLPLMRTPRLPVVEWTDAPADLNGLIRFPERRNLVSARVASHFKSSLPNIRSLNIQWDEEKINQLDCTKFSHVIRNSTISLVTIFSCQPKTGVCKNSYLRKAAFVLSICAEHLWLAFLLSICAEHLCWAFITPIHARSEVESSRNALANDSSLL
jgi:hypothetical protein